MAEGKRYFWLKLYDDFFDSKRIKKLRRLAGGDTYTVIYLKIQLLAMKKDGVLEWTGLEDSFAEELALDLDESTENVEMTLRYLLSTGLAEMDENSIHYFFPYAVANVGSEGASAKRVREFRERQSSQCNALPLQSNADVTQVKRISNGEKEIEKEIEPNKELDIEIDSDRGVGEESTEPTPKSNRPEQGIDELINNMKRAFLCGFFDLGYSYDFVAAGQGLHIDTEEVLTESIAELLKQGKTDKANSLWDQAKAKGVVVSKAECKRRAS